ncbi:MAG: S41 family peptidase [Candidatus Omnitrophota bacterium]
MRKRIIIVSISLAIILALSGLAVSEIEKKKKDDLYRQVELFSDALAIIQTDYVDEPKSKDLIYGALKGMLASLDPHSQFMDPDTYNELKVDTEGKFGGVGIEITLKDGLLTIITPIEDTPAWKAGLKSGDQIVKINNDLTREITLSEAVKKMRGKPGEPVNLTILRESEKKLLEFKIIRGIIKIKDIKEAKILEDGIAYIRLIEFREDTGKNIISALDRLNKEGMSALVLDLRNNPGGLLDAAVKVAEQFIEKGRIIVTTKSRIEQQNMEIVSQDKDPILNIPMVVLINEGSASGSEIVAGALKDYKRAIIMGTKSFGKGSVQTVIPLSDGSALRLTTSKYFSPLGNEIHGKGVVPDIIIEDGIIESGQLAKAKDEEAKGAFDGLEEANEKVPEINKPFDYKKDSQLMRSVDVLKAAKILGQSKIDEKR